MRDFSSIKCSIFPHRVIFYTEILHNLNKNVSTVQPHFSIKYVTFPHRVILYTEILHSLNKNEGRNIAVTEIQFFSRSLVCIIDDAMRIYGPVNKKIIERRTLCRARTEHRSRIQSLKNDRYLTLIPLRTPRETGCKNYPKN